MKELLLANKPMFLSSFRNLYLPIITKKDRKNKIQRYEKAEKKSFTVISFTKN